MHLFFQIQTFLTLADFKSNFFRYHVVNEMEGGCDKYKLIYNRKI